MEDLLDALGITEEELEQVMWEWALAYIQSTPCAAHNPESKLSTPKELTSPSVDILTDTCLKKKIGK